MKVVWMGFSWPDSAAAEYDEDEAVMGRHRAVLATAARQEQWR